MNEKEPPTLLGNPLPENAPLEKPDAKMPHLDLEAMAFREKIILNKRADYEDAEIEEIHSFWKKVFASRGTKDAEKEAKFVSHNTTQDGMEIAPLLQSRIEMWARTEWSPNMPEELRAPVKDFAGECEAIARCLKKQGYAWLDEFRSWIRYSKEANAYDVIDNQAEPMNFALRFIERQEEAMEKHPEIAGDTVLQALLKVMRGGKAPIEARLKTLLSLGIKQFQEKQWYELCTPAGTYDLRTGKLISKNNGMTMTVTSVTPDLNKKHFEKSAWKQFLEEDVPEKEKRDYMQMAVGYSLYGELPYGQDPLLSIWDGEAGAGKSKIFNAIAKSLGSYAAHIDIKVFTTAMADMQKQHQIALMFGKRFALCAELDENMWLSPDTLKDIVSTDRVTAEEKYKKPFDFKNTCSFHMITNYAPQVKNVDDKAVHRRIRVCTFTKTFTNPDGTPNENVKDPTLPGRAIAEQDIILGWAIEGAIKFAKNGFFLPDPPLIREDTDKYFNSCDWFAAFLREECQIEGEASDTVTALSSVFVRFQKWCDVSGRKIYGMDATRFGKRLREWNKSQHALSILRSNKGVRLLGLALRGGTEAAYLAEKQVYGTENTPSVTEATPEDIKEAEAETGKPAVTAKTEKAWEDPLGEFDQKAMGDRIDAMISVDRQKEIASLASSIDTPERAIRTAVERRLPDTLARLRELMEKPADEPLMPDDETLLVLSWNAIETAREKRRA